jgi:regulator of RNase E activity RraA
MERDEIFRQLRAIRTPIISDVIEWFGVRPRTEGWMNSTIRSLLPSLGAMVGYACTGKTVGWTPSVEGEPVITWPEVWRYVERSAAPSVMVVQDLDDPSGRSCAWGDVSASIFLRLGAVGVVTNGGVRDIHEVEALGFHLFAPAPVVGHSYLRFVTLDAPVNVGGLAVRPGDLLHGDDQGVTIIPREVPLEELVAKTREFLHSEKTIIDYCKTPGFSLSQLGKVVDDHNKRVAGSP